MAYPLHPIAHFALLDNNYDDQSESLLFEEAVQFIRAEQLDEVSAAFAAIEQALCNGHYLVGFTTYELSAAFGFFCKKEPGAELPLLEFGVFKKKSVLNDNEVQQFIDQHKGNERGFLANLIPKTSEHEYEQAIAAIKVELEEGNSYQVNYTYEIGMEVGGDLFDLYDQLRKAQAVPFGALLNFPSGCVLSRSPELFFEKHGNKVTTRPMKGTEPRDHKDAIRDKALKKELITSPKQRAENLMIVDLLRNDLGRIATLGSVRVEKLFEVETYQTVHQMTSTISAEVPPTIGFTEIMRALFPCGSITGAPKIKTTEIINRLEQNARAIYCGAIGYMEPQGDMVFNVPIRTLMVDNQRNGRFHIGGGVVYDSVDQKEFEETLVKGRFLFNLKKDFNIIESLYFAPPVGAPNESAHLKRMSESAQALNFRFDENKVKTALDNCYKEIKAASKVRIELSQSGEFIVESEELQDFNSERFVYLSSKRINQFNPIYKYKTTNRDLYRQEFSTYRRQKNAYDVLFANENNELTEASNHNIVLRFGNNYVTPPLNAGILAGIGRANLLQDLNLSITERSLTVSDLRSADEILLVNSVRGVVTVTLKE